MKLKRRWVAWLATVGTGLIMGCAGGPSKAPTPASDPDLVMMPSMGGGSSNVSMAGVTAMTRDEVYQCATMITELEQKHAEIRSEGSALDNGRRTLVDLGKSLDRERATVDSHNGKQVAEFNRRIEQHHADVQALNKRVTEHNQSVTAGNTKVNKYNTACAGRAYRKSDAALLPEAIRKAFSHNSRTLNIPVISETSDGSANTRIHLGH